MLRENMKLQSKIFGQIGVVRKIDEGAQGGVYQVRASSGDYALKVGNSLWTNSEQRNRLQDLVHKGPPNNPPGSGKRFIWPLDFIEIGEDSFGYIMDLIDTNRFCSISEIKGKHKPQPSLDALCEISFQLVHSFRALHLSGYCYRDISTNNIFIDPKDGDVLIFDNDNVSYEGDPTAQMGGTPGFTAPEVVMGSFPSTLTDLHSLAVLLFDFWMWHHPFHGALEADIEIWTEEATKKLYGENPCFMFDPKDRKNRPPQDADYATVRTRWELCPPSIQQAFIKTFTLGAKDPNQRVTEGVWRSLFLTLKEGLQNCGQCQAQILVDIENGAGAKCWRCGVKIPEPAKLIFQKSNFRKVLPLLLSTKLRPHHFNSTDEVYEETDVIFGQILQDPKNPKVWLLGNKSKESWDVRLANGNVKALAPGLAVPLNPKIKIYFKGVEITVQR